MVGYKKNIKCRPDNLCAIIFTLCLSVRSVEYFLIETDKTVIGENILHKVVGILLLARALKSMDLKWRDIGFQRNGFLSGVLKGSLLGSVCFLISYGLESALLASRGTSAHLEIYISSFSLTGPQIKNTDLIFFVPCVLSNIVNVWMEEGVFRGLFLKTLSRDRTFWRAGSDRRDPIRDLAYRNAGEKLYERRNVIFLSRLDGDRLYDPFWRYGDQMGIALPYDRKYMGGTWRPFSE